MSLPYSDSTPWAPLEDRFNEVDGAYVVGKLGATQNIADSTNTKVTGYTSTIIDQGGGYVSYIGSGNFQIGIDGFYKAYANAGFAFDANGQRRIEIRVDGVIVWIHEQRPSSAGNSYVSTVAPFYATAGQLVAMHVQQTSGSSLALDTDQCRLVIERGGQLWTP